MQVELPLVGGSWEDLLLPKIQHHFRATLSLHWRGASPRCGTMFFLQAVHGAGLGQQSTRVRLNCSSQTDKMQHLQQQSYPENDEKDWSQPGAELELFWLRTDPRRIAITPVDVSVARPLPMANTHEHTLSSMSSPYLSPPRSL